MPSLVNTGQIPITVKPESFRYGDLIRQMKSQFDLNNAAIMSHLQSLTDQIPRDL